MTEPTEIAMQTTEPNEINVLLKKVLTDLEQQSKIITETVKQIEDQKQVLKDLNAKINGNVVENEDDDEEEYESAEEDEEEVDIRWTAMLKLIDAHQNISESVHKLIHEDDDDDDDDDEDDDED